MAKKDFSKVNTNALYEMREEATATDDDYNPSEGLDAKTMEIIDQQKYKSELAHCKLPDDAPEPLKEARAKARQELGLLDDRPRRKNQKRKNQGMQSIYTYLSTENLDFLEVVAGLGGISRQLALNNILDEARKQNPIYKQALELRELARKADNEQ